MNTLWYIVISAHASYVILYGQPRDTREHCEAALAQLQEERQGLPWAFCTDNLKLLQPYSNSSAKQREFEDK